MWNMYNSLMQFIDEGMELYDTGRTYKIFLISMIQTDCNSSNDHQSIIQMIKVIIPQIPIAPTDITLLFKQNKFSISLDFAITIIKSQGQRF